MHPDDDPARCDELELEPCDIQAASRRSTTSTTSSQPTSRADLLSFDDLDARFPGLFPPALVSI